MSFVTCMWLNVGSKVRSFNRVMKSEFKIMSLEVDSAWTHRLSERKNEAIKDFYLVICSRISPNETPVYALGLFKRKSKAIETKY